MELIRPVNGLMAAAAVLVGAFVSRSPTDWGPATAAACAAFAAAAGANALNDGLDRDTDTINRPGRPVPSGRMSPGAALAAAGVAFIVSLALAATVSGRALALVAGWLVLTAVYSRSLKGVPIAGNVAVAAVASTPFLMGGFSQGKYLLAMIPTAIAFLLHLAREIVKDIEDIEGDRAAGLRTLAVRQGPEVAWGAARGVLIALIGLAAVPFALGIYGWGYAAFVVVIDVLLIRAMISMTRGASKDGAARISAALKLVMVLGLAAFAAGTF
ncbi:MAG: geranylgeranylglycerol-phosphate geranylgeranyltransferase [Candidatus Eisenbacteria bacterium]|nr:geranylgeranylglycerol-phosphate geranylgeranyltransferase [Candidatus Eisenbacteria bacterium]